MTEGFSFSDWLAATGLSITKAAELLDYRREHLSRVAAGKEPVTEALIDKCRMLTRQQIERLQRFAA